MCYISVTLKHGNGLVEEFKIKLSSDQLVSLETPYYVVVEEITDNIIFSYVYSDSTIKAYELQLSTFKITYGENTGRVFKIVAQGSFYDLKGIDENISIEALNEVQRNNLKLGISIYNAIVNLQVVDNNILK